MLNSAAIELDKLDTIAELTNMGLPQEVITRIEELWEKTKIVGGHVIQIGKVLLFEIMKFVRENPNLAIGVAIGAAIGALTSMIPFIGPLIAPLATAISILVGGIAGYRNDQGKTPQNNAIGITQEIISIAKKFFELFCNICNALKAEFAEQKND